MTTKASPPPNQPAPRKQISIDYDDVSGLKVSATPDMVSSLLQHAGIVQRPQSQPPAIDWMGAVRVGLSAIEQILQAIKVQEEKEELRRVVR